MDSGGHIDAVGYGAGRLILDMLAQNHKSLARSVRSHKSLSSLPQSHKSLFQAGQESQIVKRLAQSHKWLDEDVILLRFAAVCNVGHVANRCQPWPTAADYDNDLCLGAILANDLGIWASLGQRFVALG
jgi:hypothetical protein